MTPPPATNLYKSFDIQGFRQFESIHIDHLNRVNLILGPNNSGKTSLLEAIFSHACGLDYWAFIDLVMLSRHDNIFHGAYDYGEKIIEIFNYQQNSPFTYSITGTPHATNNPQTLSSQFTPSTYLARINPIRMQHAILSSEPSQKGGLLEGGLLTQPYMLGEWESHLEGKARKGNIIHSSSYHQSNVQPFLGSKFHNLLSHRYPDDASIIFGALKRNNILDEFVKEMQQIFPEINAIDILPFPDGRQSSVYIRSDNKQPLQLSAFGDGVRRWFCMLGYFITYPNLPHCIEEVDSMFHPSALETLSEALVNYSHTYNNQLFMTSHNIEFADIFLETLYGENGILKDRDDCVSVYTIVQSESGQHKLRSFTGREAYDVRNRFKLELR